MDGLDTTMIIVFILSQTIILARELSALRSEFKRFREEVEKRISSLEHKFDEMVRGGSQ